MGTRLPRLSEDPRAMQNRVSTYENMAKLPENPLRGDPRALAQADSDRREMLFPMSADEVGELSPKEVKGIIGSVLDSPLPLEAKVSQVNDIVAKKSQSSKTKISQIMSEEDYTALQYMVEGSPMQSRQDLDKGIAEQEELLKKAQGIQPNVDISPLLALSDTWFGGNLSKGYRPPMNQQDLLAAEAELQQQLNKERYGAAGRDIQLLNALKNQGFVQQGVDTGTQRSDNIKVEVGGMNQPMRDANVAEAKAKEKAKEPKAPKPPSQAQLKAAGYAHRMRQAEEIFENLGKEGYSRATLEQEGRSKLFDFTKPEMLKEWEQAEINFVHAVLRPESGAAISDSEFANAARQYFPRPGDSAQVIAQKALNRKQKFESTKAEAGSAYDIVPAVAGVSKASNKREKQRSKAAEILKKRKLQGK